MSAKSICVEDNIGLVHACAKKFLSKGIEYEDIVQAGCLGLTKASKSFDETRGTQFSTYAVPVILGEIKQLFRESGALKISRSLKDLSLKINRETEKFLSLHGRSPSINELSEILEESRENIFEALEASQKPLSLTAVRDDKDEELDVPIDSEEEKISARLSIGKALDELDEIDKNMIILRFFKGKTQTETAKILGLTQVKVSRREKVILKELRAKLS